MRRDLFSGGKRVGGDVSVIQSTRAPPNYFACTITAVRVYTGSKRQSIKGSTKRVCIQTRTVQPREVPVDDYRGTSLIRKLQKYLGHKKSPPKTKSKGSPGFTEPPEPHLPCSLVTARVVKGLLEPLS